MSDSPDTPYTQLYPDEPQWKLSEEVIFQFCCDSIERFSQEQEARVCSALCLEADLSKGYLWLSFETPEHDHEQAQEAQNHRNQLRKANLNSAQNWKQALQEIQENSLPILTKFKAWLDKQNVNPSSKLGEAILYTLKIWSRLTVYCSDGRLEIDNNEVENKIRPFAVGRKNWLFSTSQSGAKSSANLYSIIETAKANGLNEYEYLRWLFTKLPSANSVEDFESLLPWNIEQEKLVNWVYA